MFFGASSSSAADGELRAWDTASHRTASSVWFVTSVLVQLCCLQPWAIQFYARLGVTAMACDFCRAHAGSAGVYSVAAGAGLGNKIIR